jgi:hypothetical protein
MWAAGLSDESLQVLFQAATGFQSSQLRVALDNRTIQQRSDTEYITHADNYRPMRLPSSAGQKLALCEVRLKTIDWRTSTLS